MIKPRHQSNSPKSNADTQLPAVPHSLFSRREFLKLLGSGLGYSAVGSLLSACDGLNLPAPGSGDTSIPTPSPEYTVLKRTSFGVHRDELSAIQSLGIDAYLEQQLDYTNIDDGDLDTTIATLFPLTLQSPKDLIVGFPDNSAEVAHQMAHATQYRQIFSRRQLYEVMVEFWSDHFNIHLLNGLEPTLKPQDDLQVIRAHALGNFRDLLGASAQSPAMLFYLDNFYNIGGAANENYARELMELHTLGVDGGYSETDVQEVARCFTGWTIRFSGDTTGDFGTFKYEPTVHDDVSKTVLGTTIPAGGGQADGTDVLDLLANHPATAQHLATKLCRRFISDSPSQSTIDEVAAAFTASGGDIKATLRALFASTEFSASYDQKITRPTEHLAGSVRALAPDTAYPSDDGLLLLHAQYILGQLPFYWATPDGYPDTQDYWISTGGLLNRWRMAFLSYAPYVPEINVIDIDYSAMLNGANTVTTIVDTMTDEVLMRPLSESDRSSIINWLVNQFGAPANYALSATDSEQLAALIAAVLTSSAYFQLR